MTDVDEAILTALEEVTATAPPPVPADSIAAAVASRSEALGSRRRLLVAAAAALVAGIGIGGAAVIAMGSSVSNQPVQVETVDEPPETSTAAATSTSSSVRTVESSASELVVAEGGWLSEIVPEVAEQIPGVDQEQLWAELEMAQPQAPFDPGPLNLPANTVEGMSNDRLRWEGLLLTTDYQADGDPDAADVIAAMHDEFLQVTDELGYDRAMDEVGLTPYEVVIIASLIEADATVDADRPRVARVIYNRLAEGMQVGLDSPLFYRAQDRDLGITVETLDTPGHYNLRHPAASGLPPTPVGAVSPASLEAAMNPADGPWLFYTLADEAGSFIFASTLEEHSANVAAAREKGLLD